RLPEAINFYRDRSGIATESDIEEIIAVFETLGRPEGEREVTEVGVQRKVSDAVQFIDAIDLAAAVRAGIIHLAEITIIEDDEIAFRIDLRIVLMGKPGIGIG